MNFRGISQSHDYQTVMRKFINSNAVFSVVRRHAQRVFTFSAPEGPPEKVHCVALTSTTIQVSWHPPKPHLRNGLIKGYKVLYVPEPQRLKGSNLQPKTTRLSTVTTVLDHLQKFTNYSLQVLAFTQGGDGKYSRPVSCITLTDGKKTF